MIASRFAFQRLLSLVITAAIAAAALIFAPRPTAAAEELPVGVARVDITPDYPIRLNGFGFRRDESVGVGQRIWAKALAIGGDDQGPAILVTLDSLGVRLPLVEDVAARLNQQAGIRRERFIVTFTHSHCTPKVNGSCDNIFSTPIPPDHQAHIDQYTRELADKIEQAALAALANRRPGTLHFGRGTVGFAKNRRPQGGPVDHDLPTLFVRDAAGKVVAIYASYACHCVTLSHNFIGGDWAGYAQEEIERQFPGAIGLIAIGCGSDANPQSGVTGDKVDVARGQGLELAGEVARLAAGPLRPIPASFQTTLNRIPLPLNDPPTRESLAALIAKGGPPGYNAQTQLDRLDRGEALLTQLDYPIQTLSFGNDLCLIFLAGEVCVDYSQRLKKELAADRIWVHGYSNDFCAYIPSERLLQEGGYGGGSETPYFALPTTLRAGLEQKIIDEVRRQVPPSFLSGHDTQGVPPKSAADSLRCLNIAADLQVDVVAAEPLVASPVAIDFGVDGRLWVAEMLDYARGVDETFAHSGRIRFLLDRDADGRFDQSQEFLGGLRFPTDVKVWRDGILVCDAPNILFARDTDGDGRADDTRTLFSGFATHNPHARVNSLRWGLDGWLHGSCGLFGGDIVNERGETVALGGRDFRLRPDAGLIEPATGRTQQSRVRDDWGDWFGCSNGSLARHYPVDDAYYRRNPAVTPPATEVYVPTGPNAGELFPVGDLVLFKLSGAPGRATSACGLEIYRDIALGDEYAGNSFTCEPVHQLVYRQVLRREGAVIHGARAAAEQDREFLTSTDHWFRPVQVRTGPDGALWVVDMYRYVIEHPQWIPEETRAQLNLLAGQERGRIYRISRRGTTPGPLPSLAPARAALAAGDAAAAQQLAAMFRSSSGPLRDLAHQILVWQAATSAASELERIARNAELPAARVQALSALRDLGVLTKQTALAATNDPHPGVRVHALRWCEPWAADAEVTERLIAAADDGEEWVRRQSLYSLGAIPSDRAVAPLLDLLKQFDDAYARQAVLTSLHTANALAMAHAVLQDDAVPVAAVEGVLATAVQTVDAAGGATIVAAMLAKRNWDLPTRWRMATRLVTVADRDAAGWPLAAAAVQELVELRAAARSSLADNSTSLAARIAAARFLGRAAGATTRLAADLEKLPQADADLLASLLVPQSPNQLQTALIESLKRLGTDDDAQRLNRALATASPATRQAIVQALLSRANWHRFVLEGLAGGTLRADELDPSQRERLLQQQATDADRRRTAELLASRPTNRDGLVDEYLGAAAATGSPAADLARGAELFAKHCRNCHKLHDQGHEVGPDLLALTDRSPRFLLTAILAPNRDIDRRYQTFRAATDDGLTRVGLLMVETSSSVTLREAEGKETVIPRAELVELSTTGLSLMPEGLEREIPRDQMAHLVAYLQQTPAAPAAQ